MNTLNERIEAACRETQPKTRARNTALAGVKWRLRAGLLYAGLRGLTAHLVSESDALVFDGRDNETQKARYFSAVLGCKFEVELL